MPEKTPSHVMFAFLKQVGHITNYKAARILLSDEHEPNGLSPRSRIEDRTFLSRRVVNATPRTCDPGLFADFARSAQTITAELTSGRRDSQQVAELERQLQTEAADEMCRALDVCGVDPSIYRNLVSRIQAERGLSGYQRLTANVIAFLATGCLGDPRAAVESVEAFVDEKLSRRSGTAETGLGTEGLLRTRAHEGEELYIGLLRINEDGAILPGIHYVSASPKGTVIGSLACDESAVTDVDPDVSRRHLRIFRQDGTWYAQGLGSTNGSMLVPPGGRRPLVIEAPRHERAGATSKPQRVEPGDLLCLGASTRFLVIRVTAGNAKRPGASAGR